jgi:hypothetical protein
LSDLKELFDESGKALASETIIAELIKKESRPWAEWSNGKPLSKQGLAKLLKPFGIAPTQWREGKEVIRGYARAEFEDSFARYLVVEPLQTVQGRESLTYTQSQPVHTQAIVPTVSTGNSSEMNQVPTVPTQEGIEVEVFEI